ncbi:MAG: hypothetical protein ACJ72W_14000 [Actinoallomurus sp.]
MSALPQTRLADATGEAAELLGRLKKSIGLFAWAPNRQPTRR